MTFDSIKDHLKTLTAFKKKLIILNFPVPKKTKNEKKILRKMKLLRRLEVNEKNWLREHYPEENSFYDAENVISK